MSNLVKSLTMPDGQSYEFLGKSFYGVCNSLEGDLYKVVTIPGFERTDLVDGTRVSVLFTQGNKMNSIYLRITNGRDVSIASSTVGMNFSDILWQNGQIVDFIYSGGSFHLISGIKDNWFGICTTSSNTASKTCTIQGFSSSAIKEWAVVRILFSEDNLASSPTINISGTNEYPIYRTLINSQDYSIINKFSKGVKTFVFHRISNSMGGWVLCDDTPLGDRSSRSDVIAASTSALNEVYNIAINKYEKPSGGIPASDIADGVIPTVPANVSAFTNDSGYLTLATLPIYDGTVI